MTDNRTQLDRIEAWISKHDTDERVEWEKNNARHNELQVHIAESEGVAKTIHALDEAINGNGRPGLKIETDRNTQAIAVAKRFIWALVATTLALVGAAVKSAL